MGGIDVVVPCYQYGRFLRDSVGSILSQRVDQLRVLIIDNASTDNSAEVAQEIARGDTRVELVLHASNRGQHASYNEAIDWASSEYFMIFDADDVLAPGALARATAIMEADRSIAFSHGVELEAEFPPCLIPLHLLGDARGDWQLSTGVGFIERICSIAGNFVGATTVVRRTSAQKEAGHYHRELDRAIDLNMWLRLAALGNVAELHDVQAIRRIHGSQLSTFYRSNPVDDLAEIYKNISHFLAHEGARLHELRRAGHQLNRSMAAKAVRFGLRGLRHGQTNHTADFLEFAVRTFLGRHDQLSAVRGK